jgi:endonuclease I
VNAAQEYNSGNGWTREHVWAKSRGDFGTALGPGTDLHHLRPENDVVNSIRSNYYFDEGGSPVMYNSTATGCFKNSLTYTFEPRDAVKGDVARMIMYMAVRYEGENGEPDLEMTESIYGDSDKQPFMGVKSTLMQWNLQDLPDDFERNRNEVVYKYQGNRNPFIDHPEYATAIWGSTSTEVEAVAGAPEQSLFFSNSQLNIISATPIQTVVIYTVTGQLVVSESYNNVESVHIAADRLPQGICLVVINGNKALKAVRK